MSTTQDQRSPRPALIYGHVVDDRTVYNRAEGASVPRCQADAARSAERCRRAAQDGSDRCAQHVGEL